MSTSAATPKSEPEHLSVREHVDTSVPERTLPGFPYRREYLVFGSALGLNSYHLHYQEICQTGLGRTQGPVEYGLPGRDIEWGGPIPPAFRGAQQAAAPTGPESVDPRVSAWVEQQSELVGRWSYGKFRQVQEAHSVACQAAAQAAAIATGDIAARSGHIDDGYLADNEHESGTKREDSRAVRITPHVQGEFSNLMAGSGLRHQRNVGVLSNVSSDETTAPQGAAPAASEPAPTATSASASTEGVSDSSTGETTTPPPTPPPPLARRCGSAPLQEQPERMPVLTRRHSC